MKHRGTVLLLIAGALLFVAAANAQTYKMLYTYPNTDANDSGITYPSVLSQAQDRDLYSTIQTNGTTTYGTVYKMTTGGAYSAIYTFCTEAAPCTLTGGSPTGGGNRGLDGNSLGRTAGGGT